MVPARFTACDAVFGQRPGSSRRRSSRTILPGVITETSIIGVDARADKPTRRGGISRHDVARHTGTAAVISGADAHSGRDTSRRHRPGGTATDVSNRPVGEHAVGRITSRSPRRATTRTASRAKPTPGTSPVSRTAPRCDDGVRWTAIGVRPRRMPTSKLRFPYGFVKYASR